jgi:Leucine-rich repeat (LRR) protein
LKILKINFNNLSVLPKFSDAIEELECGNNCLRVLPDLSNYKNLKKLFCNNNQLTKLPNFNDNLEQLDCSNNNLSTINIYPRNLMYLDCSYNEITKLPEFNEKLLKIVCECNKLVKLPRCNENLKLLVCGYNYIDYIPYINEKLKTLYCNDNELYILPKIPKNVRLVAFRNPMCEYDNIIIINKFKYTYYCLYCKKQLMKILWNIREKIAMKRYHPNNLIKLLSVVDESDITLDILDSW